MTRHEEASPAAARLSTILQPAYAALLVSAVMLPLVGAISRWVAFRVGGQFADPIRFAVSAPLPELAARGMGPVLVTLLIFGVANLTRDGSRLQSPSRRLSPGFTALIAAVVVLVASALLIGLLPAIVLTLITVATIVQAEARRSREATSTASIALLVVTFLIVGALSALPPAPLPAAGYTFKFGALVPNGTYLRMGESGSSILLASCADRGLVVEMPSTSVDNVSWPAPPRRPLSLDSIRATFGSALYDRCP